MTFKFYNLIFSTYCVLGLVTIRYTESQFKILRLRRAVLLIFIATYAVIRFILYPITLYRMLKYLELSSFAIAVACISSISGLAYLILEVSIYLIRQNQITQLLENFRALQKVCVTMKFNVDFHKLEIKTFFVFCLYFLYLVAQILHMIYSVALRGPNLEVLLMVAYELVHVYFKIGIESICYVVLMQYNAMLENMNRIFEDQLELIHDDCSRKLVCSKIVQNLFKKLNRIFLEIFSINIMLNFSSVLLRVGVKFWQFLNTSLFNFYFFFLF